MSDGIAAPMMITAGGGLLGSAVSAISNAVANRQNRDWSERMANTQYQRAVEDMKKAGLNPALMYTKASPAPTPPGPYQSVAGGAGGAIASTASALGQYVGVQKPQLDMQKNMNDAQIDNVNAQRNKTNADTINAQLESEQRIWQLQKGNPQQQAETAERIANLISQRDQINSSTNANIASAFETQQRGENERRTNELWGMVMPYIRQGATTINRILDQVENELGKTKGESPFAPSYLYDKIADALGIPKGTGLDLIKWLFTSEGKKAFQIMRGQVGAQTPATQQPMRNSAPDNYYPGEQVQ